MEECPRTHAFCCTHHTATSGPLRTGDRRRPPAGRRMAACLLARDHSAPSPPPAYSRRAGPREWSDWERRGGAPYVEGSRGESMTAQGPARHVLRGSEIADSRVGSSAREPGRKDQPGPAPTSEQRATLPESEMAILDLPGLRICRSTALSAKLAPRPSASHVAGRSSGSGFGFFSGRRTEKKPAV